MYGKTVNKENKLDCLLLQYGGEKILSIIEWNDETRCTILACCFKPISFSKMMNFVHKIIWNYDKFNLTWCIGT